MSLTETKPPQVPAVAKMNTSTIGVREMGGGALFMPRSMQEVVDFAQLMAKAGPAIPPPFRGQPGACMAVTMQALRWGFDPFSVIQKAYVTTDKGGNDRIAYEAQLIAAVVNTRGPFEHRPELAFDGEGENMRCVVSATIRGESKPRTLKTPQIKGIGVRNSPLWKSDMEQQLSYYALRAFARRVCPEVLLGVYAPEDIAEMGPNNATDITPPPRPKLEDFAKPKETAPPPVTEADEREADRMTKAVMRGEKPATPHDPETGEILDADNDADAAHMAGEAQETEESALARGMRLLPTCATAEAVADLAGTIHEELTTKIDAEVWDDACAARKAALKGRNAL